MKLADEITIMVVAERVILTPRLRHAIRLERRKGSFARLYRDIAEGSFSAALDLIGDHVDLNPDRQQAILTALPGLKGALIAYVSALIGIEDEDVPAKGKKAKGKGKPITFAEHLNSLYRLGTGWLGWTPAQTLDSSPAEIREAYKGRLEMLKAIFGSSDKPAKDDRPLNEKFRGIFAGQRTVKESA